MRAITTALGRPATAGLAVALAGTLALVAALAPAPGFAEPAPLVATADSTLQVVESDGTQAFLRPDGTGARALDLRSTPAVSPEGTRLAYRSGDQVLVEDLPTGKIRRYGVRGFRPTSWSPDGRHLVMSDGRRIATYDLADRRTTVLHDDPTGLRRPAYSPDGRTIAFVVGDDTDSGLLVMDVDGTHRRALLGRGTGVGVIAGFDWAPDGRSLVVSVHDGADSAREGLTLVSVDGSSQVWLTEWNGAGGGAAYSPDGSRIAYTDDNVNLRLMDTDGTDDVLVASRVWQVRDWFADPVRCAGTWATHRGTPVADLLVGSPGDDVIWAGAGDDTVTASGGDDLVCGGQGLDMVDGGAGTDRLKGDLDDDILTGGRGSDRVVGGDGHDSLDGGDGRDLLFGGRGHDTCVAGETLVSC